ncbi:hypothetical protein OV142_29565 [Nannocystis sp. SCPEA4]|nr:hypothetical protein [Nannocystis sp. SCPEA4]
MVGSKLANYDFTGEVGELGEILEKSSGAEMHLSPKRVAGDASWPCSERSM